MSFEAGRQYLRRLFYLFILKETGLMPCGRALPLNCCLCVGAVLLLMQQCQLYRVSDRAKRKMNALQTKGIEGVVMMNKLSIVGMIALTLSAATSHCNRPMGNVKPLSPQERADVLAPSMETAKLEARLAILERSVSGTATHNRLDAGALNASVTTAMVAELATLEEAWDLRQKDVVGRFEALRHRLHLHR